MQIRRRYYTPDEARSSLAAVMAKVAEVQEQVEELRPLRRLLKANEARAGEVEEEMQRAVSRADSLEAGIQETLRGLEEQEIDIKDLDEGLIDFPGLLRGIEVCICYRQGEEGIAFWHGVKDGFTGRRPLTETHPSDWEWCN